ncbi:MAG: Dabb family protein [Bacteroidota bacterium]
MKKVVLPLLGLILALSACQVEPETPQAKDPIADAVHAPMKGIVHTVYFNVLDSLSADELAVFIKHLKRLEQIEGVHDFKVGAYQELGDPRALNAYECAILMTFSDSTAYREYQKDPIHLDVKKAVGPYLAGRPASYDFVTQ